MRLRSLYWTIAVGGVMISVALLLWGMFVGVTLRLSGEDIQARINTHIPKTTKGVTIQSAIVRLDDGLIVDVVLRGKKLGKTFTASISGEGHPVYDPLKGTFRFAAQKVVVKSFEFEGESITEQVTDGANRYITDKGLRDLAIMLAPKFEKWAQETAAKTMTLALSLTPAYKLPDTAKGYVARAVLDDVKVDGNELVISFTLMRLIWWMAVLGMIILFSFGFMIALMNFPGWGMAVLILSE